MVAQKREFRPHYEFSEDSMHRLHLVRNSLTLLMNCADDSHRGSIEPLLLASHLQLLVEQLNSVIEQAAWAGKGV